MIDFKPDLTGELTLFKNSGKQWPINGKYWGHANVENEIRQDSYEIKLIDKQILYLGEKGKASFKYKFSSIDNFNLNVKIGQVIVLNEGAIIIGEFLIEEILNEALK